MDISGELMLLDDKIIGINDLGQIIIYPKSSESKTIWINNLNDRKKKFRTHKCSVIFPT